MYTELDGIRHWLEGDGSPTAAHLSTAATDRRYVSSAETSLAAKSKITLLRPAVRPPNRVPARRHGGSGWHSRRTIRCFATKSSANRNMRDCLVTRVQRKKGCKIRSEEDKRDKYHVTAITYRNSEHNLYTKVGLCYNWYSRDPIALYCPLPNLQ